MNAKIAQNDGEFLRERYQFSAQKMYGKPLGELDANQLHEVITEVVRKEVIAPALERSKMLYSEKRVAVYFSIEFLIGRVVLDALTNTGIKEITREILRESGIDINVLETVVDTALGNGGLGRLAACFVESAATMGYPLFGYGVYYNGFFKQQFRDNQQVEEDDDWTRFYEGWFKPCEEDSVVVNFQDTKVRAVPYELPIIGYSQRNSQNVRTLTLWRAVSINGETNEKAARISDRLYPDDSTDEGKELRLRQEYFFVSATMQKLMKIHYEKFGNFDNFEDYYCFQMNDTHPVLACVEYIRILKQYGYTFKDASAKAKKCFAYTNHTVMPEALEKWPIVIFKNLLPECFKIVEELNQELIDSLIAMDRFNFYHNGNKIVKWEDIREYELFADGMIYMSRIACYISFKINGVAEVHSEIIKEKTLHNWYELYPERFTNVTNGVTPRRWLKLSNPYLAEFLDSKLGPGWVTDFSMLEKLERFKNDSAVLAEFAQCKQRAKVDLAKYIFAHEGVKIDPNSIYDVQVKRIHTYKRQDMNALRILYIYDGLKRGVIKDFYNTTFIVGGKAAPSFKLAKEFIYLFKVLQDVINNDPDMEGKMKVVFLTNFNVSYGEKVYAAANFSEQISTVGTEASGTGNMKFMMNGAPTIGTWDGANIEIFQEASTKNNYDFGSKVDEFEDMKKYFYRHPEYLSKIPEFTAILEYLKDGRLNGRVFWDIYNTLKYHDGYFVMYDLPSYVRTSLRAFSDYAEEQRTGDFRHYTRKGFKNTTHCAKFSSDRCIREYAETIWNITPVTE